MKSRTEKPQPQKLLVTIRETANMLSLSVSTIRRYLDSGILTDVRVGKRRMFHVRDIVAFAENGVSLERLQRVRKALNQTATGEPENDRV